MLECLLHIEKIFDNKMTYLSSKKMVNFFVFEEKEFYMIGYRSQSYEKFLC